MPVKSLDTGGAHNSARPALLRACPVYCRFGAAVTPKSASYPARANTHTTRQKTDKVRIYVLRQTRTGLPRGVPCHVRKVNCALNQTQRRKTLKATAAREDLSGGGTAFVCRSVVDDDNENHRICSACVAKAGEGKARAANSAGRAQSKRPKATNRGSKK